MRNARPSPEPRIAPTVILTRAEAQSRQFAREMRAAGLGPAILFSPAIEVVALPLPRHVTEGVAIFTSLNGVRAAVAAGAIRPGATAIAVGDRTAAAANAAGLACRSAAGAVDDIVALVVRDRIAGPFVHFHGAHVTGDLAAQLAAQGHDARGLAIYDQRARKLTEAARTACATRAVVLPLFSRRTAALVAEGIAARPTSARIVALSPAVASAWPWGDPVAVAARPTGADLLVELRRLVAPGPER